MSILLTDIRARFRSLVALDRVSLHVRREDCYGFIGHNGAGKTTALRIALGLLRAESGTVTIAGHDAVKNPRVRSLVGGMIEEAGFHVARSGPQNLTMLAALQGIDGAARATEVSRVLELVGLGDVGRKPVRHYSQGMRQRLGLAQALLGQPKYLLLDEPTNGLDPEGIHELRTLLHKLVTESGVTILLSSHLLEEVGGLCNRIGVLHRGSLLVEAPTAELLSQAAATHRVVTDDDRAAGALLRAIHLTVSHVDGELRVDLGDTDPADIVQALVEAGRRVRIFTPVETTLEAIYLEYTHGHIGPVPASAVTASGTQPASGATAIPTVDAEPAALAAPRRPILRVVTYELRRLARPATVLALLVPAIIAPIIVYQRHRGAVQDAGEIAAGSLATSTMMTAFEALGRALLGSLPLLTLVLAGLASQSLAGEFGAGTLRNLLLRPFHRIEVAAGKLIALFLLALGSYAAVLGTAALSAGWAFEYGDLVERLTTGGTFPLLPAELIWPELWPAIASPIVPLLAFTAFGFLCGSAVRSAAAALALTFGAITALELARGPMRNWAAESILPGPYLPSPLSRDSHLDYFVEVAGGVAREKWDFATTVPAIWVVTCAVLAAMILRRRYVS